MDGYRSDLATNERDGLASGIPPAASVPDATLVVAARDGQKWAKEALFRRHARMVNGLAHRIMPRDSEVDDVVQDSFVTALSSLHKLENPQAFASWIASIVVRTAYKKLRRKKLLRRLGLARSEPIDVETAVSGSAPPDVSAELKAMYGLLDELPVEARIALVLRRVEGLQLDEIATQMGLSLATVKRRLQDAEQRLEAAIARRSAA